MIVVTLDHEMIAGARQGGLNISERTDLVGYEQESSEFRENGSSEWCSKKRHQKRMAVLDQAGNSTMH